MTKRFFISLTVATALAFTSFVQIGEGVAEVKEPKLSGRAVFGKLAYDKYCAQCHGANGTGTDKGPPFLHRYYLPGHHGDRAFHIAVTRGVRAHHWRFGDMKPVEGVTDRQVDMIIEYVRALQKANGIF